MPTDTYTKAVVIFAATLAGGCAATPPQQAPAKPPAFSQADPKAAGEQVAAILRFCSFEADQQCPYATIRCEAYRPNYVRSCLLKANVPPSYIAVLAPNFPTN